LTFTPHTGLYKKQKMALNVQELPGGGGGLIFIINNAI